MLGALGDDGGGMQSNLYKPAGPRESLKSILDVV